MTKDALSVFTRYAELMTYEAERPDKKFRFDPQRFKHNILYEDYITRKYMEGEDEVEEFDEDEEEEQEEKDHL